MTNFPLTASTTRAVRTDLQFDNLEAAPKGTQREGCRLQREQQRSKGHAHRFRGQGYKFGHDVSLRYRFLQVRISFSNRSFSLWISAPS